MKHSFLCVFALLLGTQWALAQKQKPVDTVYSFGGHNNMVTASVKGKTCYLQFGGGKKKEVGSYLNKDSAQKHYAALLDSLIFNECKPLTDQEDINLHLFANTFAAKIVGMLFPSPNIIHPFVVVDSVRLDATHTLYLQKTNENRLVLSENTSPELSKVILTWDPSGKFISFDPSAFNGNPLLQRYLPACISLQKKNAKAQYPQFYLLYDGSVPQYELIASNGSSSGSHTKVMITPAIGDTLIEQGNPTILTIDGKKFNVQPVKDSMGTAPEKTGKARASPKGRLISHQQFTCSLAGPNNIASYLYTPAPTDSIVFSLKIPGRTVPDTVMPIDFSMAELSDWVKSVIPNGACENEQTENLLLNFARFTADRVSYYEKGYLSALQKALADTPQAKIATPPKSSADSTPTKKQAPTADPTDSLSQNILNNITFLNAFNFDFTGKLTTSYMGVFNIFAPDFLNRKGKKWWSFGFIAGIEKINYGTANINGNDSSQTMYTRQYVLANPVNYDFVSQQITPGSKFYYEYNKYTFQSQNTVWSIYFQPTFRTNFIEFKKKDPKAGLYIHGHVELLVNEWTSTISYRTLSMDSAYYGAGSPPASTINTYLPTQYTASTTILTENFGAGLTYYVAPFAKDTSSHFFIQGTVGVSLNSPNFGNLGTYVTRSSQTTVQLPNINGTFNQAITYPCTKAFYLVRSIFLQTLSNKTELILGTTIRGLFGPGSNAPQYAIYVGLNLDLSIITDLFSSK